MNAEEKHLVFLFHFSVAFFSLHRSCANSSSCNGHAAHTQTLMNYGSPKQAEIEYIWHARNVRSHSRVGRNSGHGHHPNIDLTQVQPDRSSHLKSILSQNIPPKMLRINLNNQNEISFQFYRIYIAACSLNSLT